MKLRRVFLGAAVIALMAACGGKTETTTETATPAEETQVEQEAEVPAEEKAETPVAKKETKPAAKSNAKSEKATPAAKVAKEDPCKAKVESFVKFADELEAAQKNKTNGTEAFKKYKELSQRAAAEEAAVSECLNEPAYKGTVQKALVKSKKNRK
mgnify:CR=1 FL=1